MPAGIAQSVEVKLDLGIVSRQLEKICKLDEFL